METILCEVPAYLQDKELPEKYQVRLVERTAQPPLIKIYQPIKGEWHATGGGWLLDTLAGGTVCDGLFIDAGQNWYVSGMSNAVKLAKEVLDGH